MKISGWGQYPKIDAKISAPQDLEKLLLDIKNGNAIARGNGRAYGDSAISTQNTIKMKCFRKIISFDKETGVLIAEAGILLHDIIKSFLPLGWFPFVTPGTKYVTLGGMIATDIHGKNHYKNGSFSKYIDWIDLVTGDGEVLRCSKFKNTELFEWTMGGMGLTGVILRASIRLKPVNSAYIKRQILPANDLYKVIEIFEKSKESTYQVAWIDCLSKGDKLGRSLVILGEHAERSEIPYKYRKAPLKTPKRLKFRVPFNFPNWILNRYNLRIYNEFYYWKEKNQPRQEFVDLEKFFYPLDKVLGWNKIYGRRGFIQFQCVLPLDTAVVGLNELLLSVSTSDAECYLAVLKKFGKQEGRFSFPMEGYSLALDFPANQKTERLLEKLDDIALRYKGRFYLAKDSRISREHFLKSDTRAIDFAKFRSENNNCLAFSSSQSERLDL